jgi:hypothetical protein
MYWNRILESDFQLQLNQHVERRRYGNKMVMIVGISTGKVRSKNHVSHRTVQEAKQDGLLLGTAKELHHCRF